MNNRTANICSRTSDVSQKVIFDGMKKVLKACNGVFYPMMVGSFFGEERERKLFFRSFFLWGQVLASPFSLKINMHKKQDCDQGPFLQDIKHL